MKNLFLQKTTLLVLCTALLLSCDIIKDDATPDDLVTKGYTFAEKPTVINLSSIAGGKEIDISGTVTPTLGDFTTLTATDGKKFLVYSPGSSFVGQREELLIDLVNIEDGAKFGRLRWDVSSLDNGRTECSSASGIYDYAQIAQGQSLTLDLLDNDIFCNISANGGSVRVHDVQNTDGLNISIGPGVIADLTYTAPPGFVGKVIVIYDLGLNWIVNTNNIDQDDVDANPQNYFQAFTTVLVEIDVINN